LIEDQTLKTANFCNVACVANAWENLRHTKRLDRRSNALSKFERMIVAWLSRSENTRDHDRTFCLQWSRL